MILFILKGLPRYFIILLISNPGESLNLSLILVFFISRICSGPNEEKSISYGVLFERYGDLTAGKWNSSLLSKSVAKKSEYQIFILK